MSSLSLITDRLELLAASAELIRREMNNPEDLSRLLQVVVPDSWPPRLVGNMISQLVIERMQEHPARVGWSYWYWILDDKSTSKRYLVGRSFFNYPTPTGTVEIAYEVLDEFQGVGLATEGVKALVAWALSHPRVKRVIADAYSVASVRVLEKCGFQRIMEDPRLCMIRFECSSPKSNTYCLGTGLESPEALSNADQMRSWLRWLRWFSRWREEPDGPFDNQRQSGS